MSPDIGAIVVHEDRNITQDVNLSFCAIGAQSAPLFMEEKLNDLLNGQLAAIGIERFGDSSIISMCVFSWPLMPANVSELSPKDIEQGVVSEP